MNRERLLKLISTFSVAAVIGSGLSAVLLDSLHPLLDDLPNERLALFISLGASFVAALSAFSMALFLRRVRMKRRARRVFIIYSQRDLEEAKKISELLREGGMEPWLDAEQINAGENWREVAESALDKSAMALVLLTKNFFDSKVAMLEMKKAIQKMESDDKQTSPIIPVVFEDATVPSSIAHIQYVDMRRPDAKDYLLKSVSSAMRRVLVLS